MKRRWLLTLALAVNLTGCGSLTDLLNPPSESEKLQREIELERKKQELERLKRAGQPSSSPTPSASTGPSAPLNQNPQIKVLDAVLATTVKNNDTVRVIVQASDADGDSLEYNWSSVYTGLSSTKGEQVVWFPTGQNLAGKTNIISVSVTDKKGGTTTASLNIFVQNDGTLLVREDTKAKPVLGSLLATRSTDGRILMRATASDPAGGVLRYAWKSTAGQILTPEAAATTWQADNATGPITISLVVSNAAGLQSEGSFQFQRQADGSLTGGFTGTDITLPTSGVSLPTGTLDSQFQVVGEVLAIEDKQLVRVNPNTRTRKTLMQDTDLPAEPNLLSNTLLDVVYSPPAKQAHLVAYQSIRNVGQLFRLFSLDLDSGSVSLAGTLKHGQLIDGLSLATSQINIPFSFNGQPKVILSLTGTTQATPKAGPWVMDFSGTLEQQLPSGLSPRVVSNKGLLLAIRGSSGAEKLVSYDFNTKNETEILDLTARGLSSNGLSGFIWNHKGDAVGMIQQNGATGGQSGGCDIYVVGLDGSFKHVKTSKLQTDVKSLAFSLDDLYVSFVEFPYVYLQSPSDRRSRLGQLKLIALDKPDVVQNTKIDFSEYTVGSMEWVP